MNLLRSATFAVAALAVVGCSSAEDAPSIKVLPEALPTVSSAIETTTIIYTPTPSAPTIRALASYECRDANDAELKQIRRAMYGEPQGTAAVDLGKGWSIVVFLPSKEAAKQ